jgi:asparagine synthase (glutamine-hydrolysing)
MCGICGIAGSEDRQLIQRMCDAIHHRGPDDSGIFSDKKITLGMRRLSIIDLAGGHQPIHNEDESVWVVFNGEIYNYIEQKNFLEKKGHRFYTSSDTEVIVHLYEEYGENCVNHLRGMFAFAVWDGMNKKLLLARDKLGIKPLYFHFNNNNVIFGSEIKQILQFKGYEKRVNYAALDKLLSYKCIPDAETMFLGIQKLLPGHTLQYKDGEITLKKYWDITMSPGNENEAYYIHHLHKILEETVRMHLMSEVPLGAYLSGGLDSSAIVGTMSSFTHEPVKTFTVGYNEPGDEFEYAKIIAERFNTDHNEIIVNLDDMTRYIPEVIWHLDDPVPDPASFPSYIVTKELRKKVTVALLGEGADELFAGYSQYKFLSPQLWMVPKALRLKAFNMMRIPVYNKDKEILYTELLKNETSDTNPEREIYDFYINSSNSSLLNHGLLFDLKYVLPNYQLLRVDKITMAHSLEARVPYLDHAVVEFTASIPQNLKLKGFTDKYILRKAMQDLLPKEIIQRKKTPFATPLPSWFKDNLLEFAAHVLSDSRSTERKLFKKEYIDSLFYKQKHSIRKEKYNYMLWILLMIEMWHRVFMDNEKTDSLPSLQSLT